MENINYTALIKSFLVNTLKDTEKYTGKGLLNHQMTFTDVEILKNITSIHLVENKFIIVFYFQSRMLRKIVGFFFSRFCHLFKRSLKKLSLLNYLKHDKPMICRSSIKHLMNPVPCSNNLSGICVSRILRRMNLQDLMMVTQGLKCKSFVMAFIPNDNRQCQ